MPQVQEYSSSMWIHGRSVSYQVGVKGDEVAYIMVSDYDEATDTYHNWRLSSIQRHRVLKQLEHDFGLSLTE